MKPYLFLYNVAKSNHALKKTDHYIPISATWDGTFWGHSYTPMVSTKFLDISKLDLFVVINWHEVINDIESIAKEYFDDLLSQNNARAIADILVDENGRASAVQIAEAVLK